MGIRHALEKMNISAVQWVRGEGIRGEMLAATYQPDQGTEGVEDLGTR